MEVSQIANLDTHAVIGGGEAEAFGIDDSPEFYQMLSDTMYRDKKRAVIREVACNGWDAHVDAGLSDTPIEITLTENELIIRDFGFGIPHKLLRPIYCIFGRSSKVKRADQNGGFGLGSKAPFAYSDHFTVTNCHDGRRVVNAISRGGKATNGKPDLRAMVDVPTTQTGVTVTIPLKDAEDRQVFERVVRSVIRQGGMLATLNGTVLPRWDYSEARKHGFCTVPKTDLDEASTWVLYGTVLYPLSSEDPVITRQVQEINRLISRDAKLILIAKPNTIGVTPSRESLSYDEGTELTVRGLLEQATKRIKACIPAARKRAVSATIGEQQLGKLSFRSKVEVVHYGVMCSTPMMVAEQTVSAGGNSFISTEYREKLTRLLVAKKLKSSLVRRSAYSKPEIGFFELNNIHNRRLPLRLAARTGMLQTMMAFDARGYTFQHSGKKMRPFASFVDRANFGDTVYLARNLRDLQEIFSSIARQFCYDELAAPYGFIVRNWTDTAVEKIKAEAAKLKIKVELYDYTVVKPKRVRAPAKVTKYIDLKNVSLVDHYDEETLEDPKFFIMSFARDGDVRRPTKHNEWICKAISDRYPKTAVITTKEQRETLQKAGVKDLVSVLTDRLNTLAKSRDVLYGFAVKNAMLSSWKYAGEPGDIAADIAKIDFKLAKLVFPDRAKPSDTYQEADRIYRFLGEILVNYQVTETLNAATRAQHNITERITATFKRPDAVESDHLFGYLRILRSANAVTGHQTGMTADERIDALYETVRFLQRRYKPQPIKTTTTTEPQKEAA